MLHTRVHVVWAITTCSPEAIPIKALLHRQHMYTSEKPCSLRGALRLVFSLASQTYIECPMARLVSEVVLQLAEQSSCLYLGHGMIISADRELGCVRQQHS